MTTRKTGFLLGAAMLVSAGFANAQQVYKATGPGVIAPWNFIAPNATAQQGIMVDLLNAVAADASIVVEYVQPIAIADLQPALKASTIDIIAMPTQATPENRAQIALSNPFYAGGESLWVLKTDNTEYRSLDDLRGQAVGAIKGSPFARALEAQAGTFAEVKTYETQPNLARAVISGEIKAALLGRMPGQYRLSRGEFPEVKMPPSWEVAMPSLDAIGVRQEDSELLDKINVSLAKLMADGTVEGIFEKYGVTWVQPAPTL